MIPEHYEERRSRSDRLGTGTIACPGCDAPVALPRGHASPADLLGCPYCDHVAPVRDFLSLTPPSRPARVVIRVIAREGAALRSPQRPAA